MKKSVLVIILCAFAMLMTMTIGSYAADQPAGSTENNLVREIQEIAGNNRTILTATIAQSSPGMPFHLVYLKEVNVLRGTAPAAGTQFNVASGNQGFAQPYPAPKVGQKVIAVVDNAIPPAGNGRAMPAMAQIIVIHLLLDANNTNLAAANAAAAETPVNAPGREAGNQPKQKPGKVTVDPARGVTSIEFEP
jgi:hypothetical protein